MRIDNNLLERGGFIDLENLQQCCEGIVVLESFTNLAHVADLVATKTIKNIQ